MRTINLQTVYQLVITALLLGACLGLLGQRLSWLTADPVAALEQNTQLPSVPNAGIGMANTAPQAQDVTTSKNNNANVQVEVEVHSRGNANVLARALGPGDTEVKANTDGEGDGRSVAYITAPQAPAWAAQLPPTSAAGSAGNVSPSTAAGSSTGSVTATIAEAVVNLRGAPDLGGVVVGTAVRGQEFAIVGRDATNIWWLVCCDQGQPRWVHSGVVRVTGDSTKVTVFMPQTSWDASNTQAPPVPTPTLAPPAPTATPSLHYGFMLAEQAQFEERIRPRIFLYVYEDEEGLGGYTIRVRKDGRDLLVTQTSAAGLPGYTWPIPHERQRYTNLKVEFPDVHPAGVWEVQLADASGRAVGPVVTFLLRPDDPNQEMYVKYRKVS